jgi:hypothetical protein
VDLYPLKYIFNHSLRILKYPSCWKIANVLSLFKKGANYRPIALLSCVGKVFERIVFKYIYNYMFEHKLSFMSSTSNENGVRRGKFGGSILFAVEDIEQK